MARPTVAEHLALMERAAYAEGQLAEARHIAAEALAGVTGAALDRATLQRVRLLHAEMSADLELKGEDWHPRARSMATKVVELLGTALSGEEANL